MAKTSLMSISQALLRLVLVLGFILGGLEGLARTSLARHHLMSPSIVPSIPSFDIQMRYLDERAAQDQPLDCIVVGSSIGANGIDPHYLQRGYQFQSGASFECFNFSSAGLRAETIASLAHYLIDKYQPQFFIYAISPIDFSPYPSEADPWLRESDWFSYIKDPAHLNVKGWLAEHSMAYRYYTRYQDWLSPNFEEKYGEIKTLEALYDELGYIEHTRRRFDVSQPISLRTNELDNHMRNDVIGDYQMAENDIDGLKAILKLNHRPDTQIIIIDMPLHASFMDYYVDGEQGHASYLQTISNLATEANVPLWQLSTRNLIRDEDWRDRHHIRASGAIYFSYWLGIQLAEAVSHDFEGTLMNEAPFLGLITAPDIILAFLLPAFG